MNSTLRMALTVLANLLMFAGLVLIVSSFFGCATPPQDARRAFWLNVFDGSVPEPSAVDQIWSRFLLCELPPEQRPEGCE